MKDLKYLTAATSSTAIEFLPDEPYPNANVEWNVVVPVSDLSEPQLEAIKRLFGFRRLPDDWDSYESPPPSETAINVASKIIEMIDFNRFSIPRIHPVSGGGIQLEWDFDTREIEIEILDDGSMQFLTVESGEPTDEGSIPSANAAYVNSLLLWLTSDRIKEEAA